MRKMKLVDLLAIAASSIFLLGMTPPGFYQSRGTVRRARCASNLKQIGDAIRRYLNDNDQRWFPNERSVQ